MSERLGPTLLAFVLVAALGACADPAKTNWADAADLIYINARVYTGVPGGKANAFTAVGVRDGQIVFVGSDSDARGIAGVDTELVDLGGAFMLPGLFDNHVHAGIDTNALMEWEGGLISEVPGWVREARTIADLQVALQKEAARVGPGEWISGALNREIWHNGILPTASDLDIGTTTNPVLLTRGPHTTVRNSMALEAAGIDRTTAFPGGGHIGHDDNGDPNGRLYDSARRLAAAVAPKPLTSAASLDKLKSLLLQFSSSGVSSVNVAGVRPDQLRHFQALYAREGENLPRATLQIRLRPGYDVFDDLDESVQVAIAELEGLGVVTGFGNDRLRIGAIKMSIDGGLSAPAYWSTEGYEDRPDYTGAIRIPAEAFYPVARRAHELGWQLGIHTMGDGAVEMVVEQLDRILTELPRENHRHYLHHVAVKPSESVMATMAKQHIGVASQPAFTVGLGAFAVESLTEHREETMNPTKSLQDAGIWVSWGSDGAPYGPGVTLWTGITRKGWDGRVYGPEEAVDREEAIRLHTWAPAYQTFSEERLGTIEIGKLADFTIIAEDFFEMDADRIRYLPVLRTIVGGREIWSAQEI